MSTGSDFDFGMGKQERRKSVPLPSDIAKNIGTAPLPSDVATKPGRREKRKHSQSNAQVSYSQLLAQDRRERVRKNGAIAATLVIACIISLFVDAGYTSFFDPGEVITCWGIALQRLFGGSAVPNDMSATATLLAQHPAYYRIINRVGITAMTVICGAVLAIAGALYQGAFRNPIASPSMLGVASAIQLGDVILVLVFTTTAATHLGYRYLICYICVIVTMVLLFAITKLMTGKRKTINIVNMLLTATILTQLIGVIVTYATTYLFSYEMWEIYNRISESLSVNLDFFSWAVLLITCVIGLAPVLVLRFRLNGLNFEDSEMRQLGINASVLRIIALTCGTILLMAAQVQMGTVAMLALVVPHISRMVFGAEFRKQLWGTVLMGALLLVICRIIAGFVPFIGTMLPVSVVLNFIILPFFVWMLATQQRGWEQ